MSFWLFLSQEKFGALPDEISRSRIEKSPNYYDQKFNNRWPTPAKTEDTSNIELWTDFLFGKHPRRIPKGPLPAIKSDLKNITLEKNSLVWFGHSTYLVQADGYRIMVDPIFSPVASPVFFTTKAFPGTSIFKPEDIPDLDVILISHDHWDHLDYETIRALAPRTGKIICGLGVGAHLRRWGISPDKILETDWGDLVSLGVEFNVHTQSARHFSGRSLKFYQTLWVSYVVKTKNFSFYFGGDSGYGPHYREIGKEFGPFDLVALENGQYDRKWKYVHMQPEEVEMAANDLGAKNLLPIHSGKFSISNHPWDEPLSRISALPLAGIRLITPIIGEVVDLDDNEKFFSHWWEGLE